MDAATGPKQTLTVGGSIPHTLDGRRTVWLPQIAIHTVTSSIDQTWTCKLLNRKQCLVNRGSLICLNLFSWTKTLVSVCANKVNIYVFLQQQLIVTELGYK